MNGDLILWAVFLYHMGKLFQKCKELGTNGTDEENALKTFLERKIPGEKWFPDFFGTDFKKLFLLSSCFHDFEEGKTSIEIDDSLLPYVKIIWQADRFSGWVKEKNDLQLQDERLVSIFSKVKIDKLSAESNYYLPLIPLDESAAMFPGKEKEGNQAFGDFETLMKGCLNELRDYMARKEKPDFDTFYYVAQKYLWCIPFTHIDVSLFEHLKTSAAIAVILSENYRENKNMEGIADHQTKKFAHVSTTIKDPEIPEIK